MRQRLGLADVLLKQPQLIIMDEPTQGLDPRLRASSSTSSAG
jgi:ABC-2 type transport system ATP-binding protein